LVSGGLVTYRCLVTLCLVPYAVHPATLLRYGCATREGVEGAAFEISKSELAQRKRARHGGPLTAAEDRGNYGLAACGPAWPADQCAVSIH
jgi:hypothetical protein